MDFEEIIGFFFFMLAMLAVVFLFIFGIATLCYYGGEKPACEQYARLNNAEISTQFFGASCLVKYQGRWVDYDVAVKNKQEIQVTK